MSASFNIPKIRLHRLVVPVVSKAPEEATDHFGWFAQFAVLDNPTSSERTRDLLGWQPRQPALIPDLDQPYYFEVDQRAQRIGA
jgi:hypothetical protein